jgi:hypothetical protein
MMKREVEKPVLGCTVLPFKPGTIVTAKTHPIHDPNSYERQQLPFHMISTRLDTNYFNVEFYCSTVILHLLKM